MLAAALLLLGLTPPPDSVVVVTEPLRWHIEQSEAIVVAERTTAARGVRRAVVRELVLGNGHRIGDEVEYVGGSRTSTRPRTARPTVLLF